MRRKIIIVIVVVVLVIVATITFFVIKDLQQEKSLRKEIDEIQKEMVYFEQIDVDKISKKLKATVTTGDYAKIEKAIKNYMADNLNTMLTISEALNDEVIPNALTAENYQNDGPDFVKTRMPFSICSCDKISICSIVWGLIPSSKAMTIKTKSMP